MARTPENKMPDKRETWAKGRKEKGLSDLEITGEAVRRWVLQRRALIAEENGELHEGYATVEQMEDRGIIGHTGVPIIKGKKPR